jgi:hypothetical protein
MQKATIQVIGRKMEILALMIILFYAEGFDNWSDKMYP